MKFQIGDRVYYEVLKEYGTVVKVDLADNPDHIAIQFDNIPDYDIVLKESVKLEKDIQ